MNHIAFLKLTFGCEGKRVPFSEKYTVYLKKKQAELNNLCQIMLFKHLFAFLFFAFIYFTLNI